MKIKDDELHLFKPLKIKFKLSTEKPQQTGFILKFQKYNDSLKNPLLFRYRIHFY